MRDQTKIEYYIEQVLPLVREFRSADELKTHLIGQIQAALLDSPFDIAWARSVLPDDNKENWRWYSYKRQIHIEKEVDRRGNDTGRHLLIVDDEGTEVEMRTRAQFLALCFGLGITLSQRANRGYDE